MAFRYSISMSRLDNLSDQMPEFIKLVHLTYCLSKYKTVGYIPFGTHNFELIKFLLFLDESCFWGIGEGYRGGLSTAASGRHCVIWGHQLNYKTSDYPSLLGGHSYCRNPGGLKAQPFCYTDVNDQRKPELCDIPRCGKLKKKIIRNFKISI